MWPYLLLFFISGVSCEDGMQTISEVTSFASSAARTLLYSKQIPIGSSDSYPGNITAFDPSTWTMEDDYFKDRMFAAAAIGIVIALMSFFMCIMYPISPPTCPARNSPVCTLAAKGGDSSVSHCRCCHSSKVDALQTRRRQLRLQLFQRRRRKLLGDGVPLPGLLRNWR